MRQSVRTRVKICGITRPEDALEAATLGADAIGLVFHPPSPRAVTVAQASAVLEILPPFVSVVALFVDAPPQEVRRVLDEVPVDLLQFHGEETPDYCVRFGRPYIKAVSMRHDVDLHAWAGRYAGARALLLDTYKQGVAGGTGITFDWSRVPKATGKPIILAGGLKPANVADAIRRTHPYAVDVSGGVETAKGVKDAEQMAAFIREVNSVATS